MTEMEKVHSGEIYQPMDESVLQEQLSFLERMDIYNAIPRSQMQRRQAMLSELFAEAGEGCYVESPFYANWGGHHVHLGRNVYTNYGVTFVDDTSIYIGDYTMLGPNVTIATAAHPIDAGLRQKGLQYNLPVHIGKNCWLGAGTVVLPGVTIGDNTVIGAGSVVTKDIPANVVAVGNPCRVLRVVGENDRLYYDHNRPIPAELLD